MSAVQDLEQRRQWRDVRKALARGAIVVLVCPNCDGETCSDCSGAGRSLQAIVERTLRIRQSGVSA